MTPNLTIADTFTGAPGDIVTIPISISDATGLQSLDITLNYDSNLLTILDPNSETDTNEGVKRTGIAENWQITSGEGNNPDRELPNPVANVDRETGEVKISLVNPGEPLTVDSGEIIAIDFQINSAATVDSTISIDLQKAEFGINNESQSVDDNDLDDGNLTVTQKASSEVYRFYNTSLGVHFYTASEEEKNSILENLPQYRLEGASYTSIAEPNDDTDPLTGAKPVYRFFNRNTGVHLYTVSEEEKNFVSNELSSIYSLDGIAYYALNTPTDEATPVYRFYNNSLDVHFYTPSAAERDFILAELPQYNLEGTGFYVLPLDNVTT